MKRKALKLLLSLFIVGGVFIPQSIANASDFNHLSISNIKTNYDLPSASGMDYYDDHEYVIGDDSPYLFELDKHFNIIDKTLINDYPTDSNNRIPHNLKPDFENFDIFKYQGNKYAIFLGSGSAKNRVTGYIVNLKTKEKKSFDLTNLYDNLKSKANFPKNMDVNIEGIAFAKDKFVILNRGNAYKNIIFTLDSNEMLNYINNNSTSLDSLKEYDVTLPKINGVESELSGIDYDNHDKRLLLTTSVECTEDSMNDGKILGSFIGSIKLKDLKNNLDLTNNFNLITKSSRPFITKAESITFKKSDDGVIKGMIASDNDNGSSQFFNFKLK